MSGLGSSLPASSADRKLEPRSSISCKMFGFCWSNLLALAEEDRPVPHQQLKLQTRNLAEHK